MFQKSLILTLFNSVIVYLKTETQDILEYFSQEIVNFQFYILLEQNEAVKPVDSHTLTIFEQLPNMDTIFAFSMFIGVIVVTTYFGGHFSSSSSSDADVYSRLLIEAEAYKYSDSIGTYVDSIGPIIPGVTG